jgi:cytochrome oxidase Cu insertion factor (SCO1/SenC/PrrC family)
MSKESGSFLFDTDMLFKVGITCIVLLIVYSVYNLFSKMKEINNKLDQFYNDPALSLENAEKTETETETEKTESKIDISELDLAENLETIEE